MGCETTTFTVAEQPAASVAVTEKSPAQAFEIEVKPFQIAFDQTVETVPFWLEIFKEIVPSQFEKQVAAVAVAVAVIVQPASKTVKLQVVEQFFESVTVTE